MDAPHPANALEIEVADFGPIVHAKVDLRPMTVFVGPSNTGKSYLATLLYALHRFFGGSGFGLRGVGRFTPRLTRMSLDMPDRAYSIFRELDKAIANVNPSQGDTAITLPASVMELARSGFDGLGDELVYEIMRCFGVNESAALVRKGQNARPRVTIRRGGFDGAMPLEHTLSFGGRGVAAFQTAIPKYIPVAGIDLDYARHAVRQIRTGLGRPADDYWAFEYADVATQLLNGMLPAMIGDFRLPAFYLPADRTGVMHAHRTVVSAALGNAPLAGLQPVRQTSMLSGVLADFLRQLIEIDRSPSTSRSRQSAPRHDPGAPIERNILQGAVGVDWSELISYPHFTYRPDGWNESLPLMNASSMVSELAPVVIYLRHIVRLGNVLIIEEPESHLHPAMQVEFTRQLAKIVDAGYRLIITTHSEWILEELANVVLRSKSPPDHRAGIPGGAGDAALTPDQVGVWLFQPELDPKGSVVTAVPIGENDLYDSRFDDVAIALHNDWANITSRIRTGQ